MRPGELRMELILSADSEKGNSLKIYVTANGGKAMKGGRKSRSPASLGTAESDPLWTWGTAI